MVGGFKFWLVVLSFGWFWNKVVSGALGGKKLRITNYELG
jgi:hypothetical protein